MGAFFCADFICIVRQGKRASLCGSSRLRQIATVGEGMVMRFAQSDAFIFNAQ